MVQHGKTGMAWHGMAWYCMAWHDITWHDMTWHDMTLNNMTWHDMTWHETKWNEMVQPGKAWHGMTWHDMTWHDMTFNGIKWYNISPFPFFPFQQQQNRMKFGKGDKDNQTVMRDDFFKLSLFVPLKTLEKQKYPCLFFFLVFYIFFVCFYWLIQGNFF